MPYLENEGELNEAEYFLEEAALEARKSACAKSQRGSVIVKDGDIVGVGFNNPPPGMNCIPDKCYAKCRYYAVHAEQNAVFDALRRGKDIRDSTIYHVKVKDGEIVPSGGPTCVECSKMILNEGVSKVALLHQDGIEVYDSKTFHELSLQSLPNGHLR